MPYVNDLEAIKRQADVIFSLHAALVQSSGQLTITLLDGSVVEGRYYGLQCAANDGHGSLIKVKCSVSIGDEEPGVVDALDVQCVQPKR